MNLDKESIRHHALKLVAKNGHGIGTQLASHFCLSRQVANGYLQALIKEGLIEAHGSTRARVYQFKMVAEVNQKYPRDGLQEDIVWRRDFAPHVADLPENVRGIWQYGVTEMVNNAIDHSGSQEVRVGLKRNALFTEVWVEDDGEGIFLKIQRALNLFDPREAILELAKGKLTTAPEAHAGEGIFFTSRVMDTFDIFSGRLHFMDDRGVRNVLEGPDELAGTRMTMRVDNDSSRTLKSVFDKFTDLEEYTFDRTVVPLRLAQHEGEKLVSRSQAKRVSQRFDRFKQVQLDFEGIAEIGQGFADELFRVFAAAHPDVQLTPINTSEDVANMIRRVSGASAGPNGATSN